MHVQITLLSLFTFFFTATAKNKLQVALILPRLTENEESWLNVLKRSFARIEAQNEVLNKSNIEFSIIDDDSCYNHHRKGTAITNFINRTFYQTNRLKTIAAVALFCPQSALLFTGLFGRDHGRKFPFPLFSVLPSVKAQDEVFFNVFHATNSLEIFGRSLESFLIHQQWLRVSLVTSKEETIYSHAAERIASLITAAGHISIARYIQVEDNTDFTGETFDARVVVMVAGEVDVTKLLCEAHWHSMEWPQYAWIVLSLYSQMPSNKCLRGLMDAEINLSGVFLITHGRYGDSSSGKIPVTCNSGSYLAGLMCDSINLALRAYNYCQGNCSFMKYIENIRTLPYTSHHAGELKYNKTVNSLFDERVTFIQLVEDVRKEVAYFNSSLFVLDNTIKENSILPSRTYRSPSVISVVCYLLDIIIVCSILITTFILYVVYRKEPEVKASSFSISLLSYISSFTIVFYLFLITLTKLFTLPEVLRNSICIARTWLNVLSFQGPLVTSTTIVKIFRVYRIFHPTSLTQGGRCLSDQGLIAIVLLLQLPNIVINLVWTITDTYLSSTIVTAHTNYLEISFKCHSDRLLTWTLLLMAYNTILCLILMFVAFKTRKIRRKNFKDTKKVNAFIFFHLFFLSSILALVLLGFALHNHRLFDISLYVGSSVEVVIEVSFLFVPKVYPPLKRTLLRQRVISATPSRISTSLTSLVSHYTFFSRS